ncbi:hypothetical protein [Streptomyces sp. NPDC046925]|uniref:hypothetical protein n=1 Tax=Streptomyces sp. NPDC046925 TaxID=3155375 RepID=UPI0033C4C23D
MAEPTGGADADSTFVRGMAVFSAVITATLYLLGLVAIGLAVSEVGEGADSTPMHQCRYTSHRPAGAQVLEHEVRFLPLHVMCRTTDGRAYTAPVVPSWLNPALAASFASTVAFTAGAFVQANRRAAARHERGDAPHARPAAERASDT